MADSERATNNGIETYESIANEMAELQQIDEILAPKLMDQSFESEGNQSLSAGINTAEQERTQMIPSVPGDTGLFEKSDGETLSTSSKDLSVVDEIQLLQETGDIEQSGENPQAPSDAFVGDDEPHSMQEECRGTEQSPDGGEDVPKSSNIMADGHEVQSLESEFRNTGQSLDSRNNLSTSSSMMADGQKVQSLAPEFRNTGQSLDSRNNGDESQADNLKSDENGQQFKPEEPSYAPTTSNIASDAEEDIPQTEHLEFKEVGCNSDEKLTADLREASDTSLQGECKDQEAAVR